MILCEYAISLFLKKQVFRGAVQRIYSVADI